MEGFHSSLTSFMHGSFIDFEAPLSGGVPCSSIEDMHAQLQTAFDYECTPTRAKHTTTTFQFPLDTTFHIPLDELKGLLAPQDENESALLVPIAEQKILVKDAVLNQRPDSHTLQMLAAKYITSRIGDVDASQWAVKDARWERLGWAFTCICVQSMEHWQKQADEMKEKPVLAEFIHKEPDPILANRPIYDCFGTLTLIFSTSHRSILAEYSHTPLHKLVSDIFALLAPKPIIPIAASRRRRRRRPQFMAIGPENQPLSREKATKKQKARNSMTQNSHKQAPSPDVSAGDLSVVLATVDSGERQRRRDAAQALLGEAGIDFTTLSEDQFSILSNQSPTLQQESIAMLKQYGAERLRIVYPDATSSASPSQSTTENEAPSTPISETTASKPSPMKRKRGRPRKVRDPSTTQETKVHNTEDNSVPDGLQTSTVSMPSPVTKIRGRPSRVMNRSTTQGTIVPNTEDHAVSDGLQTPAVSIPSPIMNTRGRPSRVMNRSTTQRTIVPSTEDNAVATGLKTSTASMPSSPIKRKRGRPRKVADLSTTHGTIVPKIEDNAVAVGLQTSTASMPSSPIKRKRGRPRKVRDLSTTQETKVPNTEDNAVAVGLKMSTVDVAIRASAKQGVCS